MAFLKSQGLYLFLAVVLVSACGSDSREEGTAESGNGDGDSNTPQTSYCTLDRGGDVEIQDLFGERLPRDDDGLTDELCEQACWRAVDEIAENTGYFEVLSCDADLDFVRECQRGAYGGAARRERRTRTVSRLSQRSPRTVRSSTSAESALVRRRQSRSSYGHFVLC